MKKDIIQLASGVVAGFALCLVAAYFLPDSDRDESFDRF